MYKLTPRMLQHFAKSLRKYHELFSGGRCQSWELEELIVQAIKSDTTVDHHVKWQEAGHDDKADITVRPNGKEYKIQIKSGKATKAHLAISGHRLTRFKQDFLAITNYLNNAEANIISVRYRQENNEYGKQHIYQLCYLDIKHLTTIDFHGWKLKGKQHTQTSSEGVVFSLAPSMSWQIWWKIPHQLFEETPEIIIS